MAEGSRATFDKKTHRRVFQRTTRLIYIYLAARYLEGREPDEVAEDVLAHLEQAQENVHRAWGLAEFARLGESRLSEFEDDARSSILRALGEPQDSVVLRQPLTGFTEEQKRSVVDELGRRALTGVYRQLLLGVTMELWVDYLTQMEALRVSIGLEAYAQRDPLVQYKNRAFELYQELLSSMRLGVISRMFTYRPRDLSRVQTTLSREVIPEVESVIDDVDLEATDEILPAAAVPSTETQKPPTKKSSKRRRRRR